MTKLVFDNSGFPTLLKGDTFADGAIELTQDEAHQIEEAMFRGDLVRLDNGSWVILPKPIVPPTAEEQEALRKAAYIVESDPLFFKYQRGDATKEEWLAKIEEIKARYPDPVE
jgi:hypothetical protein